MTFYLISCMIIKMKINKKLFIIILLSAFVVTCATNYAVNYDGLGRGADLVPLTGNALTGALPNGLKYFILENSLPEKRAHLALIVNAGSVLETEEQRGFAHFVEHLAFNDTARFPKLELIEYLRSLGMRFGADANAYTYYDETVYHFDVPVETVNGIKRIPRRALEILDDWTYAVSFLPEDVASESLVVLEEFRTRLGAMDRVRKVTMPIIFKGSAYANRSPIGLERIIQNATSDQLRAFYDRWYTSDNMALVFVGDFDGKALEAELPRHFNMPTASKPVNRPQYTLPPPKKNNFHVEIITDPELTDSNYVIYYKQKKGAPRGTIAYYRNSIIDYLIDEMLTMRFEETSSNPEAKALESWAGIWRWSADSRFYMMGTQPKTGNVEEALKEILLEKEAVRRYGFTESELYRAKLNFVSYLEKMLSEKDRTESRTFIRGFTNHFLYGEDMSDIEWEMEAANRLLPGINLKEISQAAKNYFSVNDCIVFLMAPQAEADRLPSAERIKSIFMEAQNASITRRQDVSLSGDLLDRVPASGVITSENRDAQTGAVIMDLANGAKVILKQTTNKNNEIVLYAIARGGKTIASEQIIFSVNLLSEMLNVSGLGSYSRTDMINKLTGKQVSVSFWNSNYYRGLQGTSTTQDIKTFFEMIHLFFTDPRLDERAIAAMIDSYRTILAHQNDDPQKVFFNELTRMTTNNHPLFLPMELRDIDTISVEHASAFLSQCLNPADYTFVFTGNINMDVMRQNIADYIASIPDGRNYSSLNRWIDPEVRRPVNVRKTINKGIENQCLVYLSWFARGSSEFNEQSNQTAAVLTEYLEILLNDEIREKLGGVYSISAGASVMTIPAGEYRASVFYMCNPARAEELIAAVKNIMADVYRQPLKTDMFNKAKEALIKEHERSIQSNLHIAQSYANSSALYSTPLSRLNDRPNAIREVTAQDVQTLCSQMLANGPAELILMPEK